MTLKELEKEFGLAMRNIYKLSKVEVDYKGH